MSGTPLQAPLELVRPDYTIHKYTDQIYKIVRFRSTAPVVVLGEKKARKGNVSKLDAALSRARRVVLELALCNPWMYFCTFTISKKKLDRGNLAEFHVKFLQWLRDMRKKYPDVDFRFVLIPEQHKDGSWHMHGLFSDISPLLVSFRELLERGENVPLKLADGFWNWPDYHKKFGFCSFGLIRDPVACGFYISKYISKSLGSSPIEVGLHLYYASKGLNRACLHGDVYGSSEYLDGFLTHHYDFCSTGMTSVSSGVDWDFSLEFFSNEFCESLIPDLESFDCSAGDHIEVDQYFDFVQQIIDGY